MSDHEFVSHFDDAVRIDADEAPTGIDETTLAEMRELAGRYPDSRSALMPMLHLVQSVDGRVSDAGVRACAEILGISTAQVNGVATFYTMFKRRPGGKQHIGVCTTALCAVLGGTSRGGSASVRARPRRTACSASSASSATPPATSRRS